MNQQIQHYILIFKIDGVFYWKVFSPQLKPQTPKILPPQQKFYPHNNKTSSNDLQNLFLWLSQQTETYLQHQSLTYPNKWKTTKYLSNYQIIIFT